MFIKLQEKQNLLLKAVEIPLLAVDTTFLAFLLLKKVVYTAKIFGRVGISDIWIHVYQSYQLFVLLNSIKVYFLYCNFFMTDKKVKHLFFYIYVQCYTFWNQPNIASAIEWVSKDNISSWKSTPDSKKEQYDNTYNLNNSTI